MAVASTSVSKRNLSDSDQTKNKKKTEAGSQKKSENEGCSSRAKRTKCPGIRLINGRIYDSENGKTCHQCRQKTRDFAATCKNQKQKQNKPCPLNFCHTCLMNRYGEKAEEMEVLEDWSCPKCRGICNCSFCMKKRGHQPTGLLVHTAKATGFSSVSELLNVKVPENFGHDEIVNDVDALPKKMATSKKEVVIASPKQRGKENLVDGKIDLNLHPLPLAPNPTEKIPKKMKQERLKQMHNGNEVNVDMPKETGPRAEQRKPKKMNQERLKKMHDGHGDDGTLLKETSPHHDEKKTKKMKREGLKEMHDGNRDNGALLKEASPKKRRISNEIYCKEVGTNGELDGVLQEDTNSKKRVSKEVSLNFCRNKKKNKDRVNANCNDVAVLDSGKHQIDGALHKVAIEYRKVSMNALEVQNKDLDACIPLPQGTELTTVAGVDLLIEDVGNALQFLEFCATFRKILNMKKGQPELVLREIIHGRSATRGKYSSLIQFHIQLLSLILKESGALSPTLSPTCGKNSWLHALRICFSESQCVSNSLPLDCLDSGAGGYDNLDSSIKLRLLNFVCDEVLGTAKIRNWIDDQNSKFAEKTKEAKERLLAAKNKEKHLRQKMLDELAKAIIAKNGASLSISEHEAIVFQIKAEAAQAHAEMLESKGMIPKKKQRSDAVRTEPILLNINGCTYWILKGYSDKSDILLQDIGTGDAIALGEKWFAYDDEQKNMIEKHISLRERRLRLQKVTEIVPAKTKSSEANT